MYLTINLMLQRGDCTFFQCKPDFNNAVVFIGQWISVVQVIFVYLKAQFTNLCRKWLGNSRNDNFSFLPDFHLRKIRFVNFGNYIQLARSAISSRPLSPMRSPGRVCILMMVPLIGALIDVLARFSSATCCSALAFAISACNV